MAILKHLQRFDLGYRSTAYNDSIWDLIYPGSSPNPVSIQTCFAFRAITMPTGRTFVFRGLWYPSTGYDNDIGIWQVEIKDSQIRLSYYNQTTRVYDYSSWYNIVPGNWYYAISRLQSYQELCMNTWLKVVTTPQMSTVVASLSFSGTPDDYEKLPDQYSLMMYADLSSMSTTDIFSIEMSPPMYAMVATAPTSIPLVETSTWSYYTKSAYCLSKDMIKVDNIAEFLSLQESYEDNHVDGSETPQVPVGASQFSDLESIFELVADELDKVLTIPQADFSLPDPFQPIADIINDLFNNIIGKSFELVTDSIIDMAKALLTSIAFMLEECFYGLRDIGVNNISSIATWFKSNVVDVSPYQPNTYNYPLGTKLSAIVSIIDEELPGLLDNIKTPFCHVHPLSAINYDQWKICTRMNFSFLNHSFGNFKILDVILDIITIGRWSVFKDSKVPFSELAPYSDDDSGRRVTGFTWGELFLDVCAGGAVGVAAWFFSKFVPPTILCRALSVLFGSAYPHPRIINVLDAIGVGYDSNYDPISDDITDQITEVSETSNTINSKLPVGFPDDIDSILEKLEEIVNRIGYKLQIDRKSVV